MEKERWIDEVLNSTQGLKRISPKKDLFPLIEDRLFHQKARIFGMSKKFLMIAASLLLAFNAFSICYLASKNYSAELNSNAAISYQEISIIDYSGY